MKNLSLIFIALLTIGIMSCKDDPCEGIINGIEVEGECQCIAPYEGVLCDMEAREKFYGAFTGTLSGCTINVPGIGDYDIPDFPIMLDIAESSSDINNVDIQFGMNAGSGSINGNVLSLDPTTTEIDAGGFPINITFAGTGTLNAAGDQIDMDLDITVLGSASTCPVVLNRG